MVRFGSRRGNVGRLLFFTVCLQLFIGHSALTNMVSAAPKPQMSPLKGIDLRGKMWRFGEQPGCKAIVVVFLSTDCPTCAQYLPKLNRMASTYKRRHVEFYGVISNADRTRSAALSFRNEHHLTFPVLFDGSGELRRNYLARRTPHAFVLDQRGHKLYSGAIEGSPETSTAQPQSEDRSTQTVHYLRDAIESALAGTPVETSRTQPVGQRIARSPNPCSNGGVTYTRDIAPIMMTMCASCHRPGQSAPFSLLTYHDVSKRAQQIVEVTRSRFMPPWKPEPDFGHFRDAQRLSDHELNLLEAWCEADTPEGASDDMPAPSSDPPQWRLGEPDLVLRMRETFHVPADGPDLRQYFVIPTRLSDDRLITAIDFHPGSEKSIHHASFFLDIHHQARKLDEADPAPGYRSFGGPRFDPDGTLQSWFPGRTPQPLPKGTGRRLPRGSDIIAEIHYVCTGKQETDRSEIGLYYAPRSSRHLVEEIQVANKDIHIPAGDARHHEQATYKLPVDTILLDVTPHMHVLGREMKVVARHPDGHVEPLIWIKDWDFNWQSQYAYARPVMLPQGTLIEVNAWYDNSSNNLLNPNSPPRDVRWGDNSSDEMLICHFQCTCKSLDELQRLMSDYKRYFDAGQTSTAESPSPPVEEKRSRGKPAFR